jgi:hypothetical protein
VFDAPPPAPPLNIHGFQMAAPSLPLFDPAAPPLIVGINPAPVILPPAKSAEVVPPPPAPPENGKPTLPHEMLVPTAPA